MNTSRAASRCSVGSVANAARSASALAATNPGWSKKCRSFTSSGAPAPATRWAWARSSRYCRHEEYDAVALVANTSARRTPSSRICRTASAT